MEKNWDIQKAHTIVLGDPKGKKNEKKITFFSLFFLTFFLHGVGVACISQAPSMAGADDRRARESLVLTLIKHGANFKAPSPDGCPVIVTAAIAGMLTAVKEMVARGADINAMWSSSSGCNISALHAAIAHGEDEVALWIINEAVGADLNAVAGGNTPLMLAVKRNALPLVKALVARGADVNVAWTSSTLSNQTALHMATFFGHEEIALYLINEVPGLNVNTAMGDGRTALTIATEKRMESVVNALKTKL